MLLFLIPLVLGFALDAASAFTTAFSRRWGERHGQQASVVLRNFLGIPLWVVGLGFAVRTRSPVVFNSTPVAEVLGWLLLAGGSAIQILALFALRWRAAAPSTRDTLVEHGPYAHIRHPIYVGVASRVRRPGSRETNAGGRPGVRHRSCLGSHPGKV